MNNNDHVSQNIENEINSNDVMLFMKGTPVFPMCGFSARVVEILNKVGVKFGSVNVLESDEMREGIKTYSNWPTIPQLYVKKEFCLLYTSPSPRDRTRSRMPSSA